MDLDALFPDPEDLQSQALIEALRKQQQRGEAARSGLQDALARQQGQAGGLRTLSMLTSLGDNPLLQGIQRTAGQQGAQMENLAARTEQRLGQTEAGINPLRALSLRLQALREERLGKQGDETQRRLRDKLNFQKQRAGAADARAAEKAAKDSERLLQKSEDEIRKEFSSLPDVKEFTPFKAAYDSLQAALKMPGGVGSTTAIFSFMKLIDPGVAVMEGDVDRIRAAGGAAAKYADLYEYALTGNTLPERVRGELASMAETLYGIRMGQFEARRKQYGGIAKERGLNVERVLPPMGGTPAPPSRSRPDQVLPTDSSGQPTLDAPKPGTVRVKINGQEVPVPASKLEAVKKRAKERGDTLEVLDG